MKRNKKHPIKKMHRRHHRTLFCLGVIIGGALGFNGRKLADLVLEKIAKK